MAGLIVSSRAVCPLSVALCSAVPHSAQNFCVPVTALPQLGQARGNAVPHSAQNFLPAGLIVPHRAQVTIASSRLLVIQLHPADSAEPEGCCHHAALRCRP